MIKRSIPWVSQPQYPAQVDRSGNLFDPSKITCLINPGASRIVDAVTGKLYTVSTNPSVVPTIQGKGIKWVEASDSYIEIASDADTILDTVNCTMIVATVRTSATTTIAATYGYDGGGGPDRVLTHLPYTDNNIYWDFGNATAGAGGGRVSVGGSAYSAAGTISIWGFVAGSRGREIWRNGIRIASDATANFTRAATSLPFRIGAAYRFGGASGFSVAHTCSLFLISKEQWSAASLAKITASPNLVYAPQQRNIYVSVAGGGLTENLGQPSETDTVSSLVSAKSQPIGLNASTEIAQNITAVKAGSLDLITGTETVQSLAVAKSSAIGQAAETDSLFTISSVKSVSVGLVTETETAQPLTAIKYAELGQASDSDEALALVSSATSNLGLIAETDTAFAITAIKTASLGLPSESDSVLSVSASKTAMLGLVTEIEYPLPLVSSASSAVGQVVETDTAFAINASKMAGIGYPTETDYIPSISVSKMVTLGLVTETGYVFALTNADTWRGEPFNFASPITRAFDFSSSITKALSFDSSI